MKEKLGTKKAIDPKDMHCSKCIFGNQIVATVFGGRIEDDGTEVRWHLTKTIPVGQTRNCFSRFQNFVGTAEEKFIYPDGDDTCINQKKFKSK